MAIKEKNIDDPCPEWSKTTQQMAPLFFIEGFQLLYV